jgi:hypothetical protein
MNLLVVEMKLLVIKLVNLVDELIVDKTNVFFLKFKYLNRRKNKELTRLKSGIVDKSSRGPP